MPASTSHGGKYVGFVDGDDYVDADMLQALYNAARINGADIVVCGGHPFPDEDKAPAWLKDALSPRDITCRTVGARHCLQSAEQSRFCGAISCAGNYRVNKFGWTKKIVVGGSAFRFKIFPAAQKITFMQDKLYYYRYSRPESIMNEPQNKDYGARISKHVNMMESIAASWKDMLSLKDSAVRVFEWAVDFLYWDIIRVSPVDRKKIAAKFCNLLIDSGYYLWYKEYSWNTRNHFSICTALSRARRKSR